MEKVTSVGTGNSLIRQCIYILDAIYTNYNFMDFISTLHLIEVNLFNNLYKDLESFKNDILAIPQVTTEFIDDIDLNAESKVPEEYCTTPIYSSIQFRKESLMYTVNIKTHQELHFSLHDAIKNSSNLPTHRLYIIKNSHFILDARDHISNFLTLFFDVQIKQCTENPNISFIKANVAIVHPLGDFHTTLLDEFEGWIKVKIAQTNFINTVIPTKLAHRLFEKKEQMARKISLKPAKNVTLATDSELTRQFVHNITDSRVDRFESCYNVTIENLLNVQSKYTPNQMDRPSETSDKYAITTLPNLYQSASKMLSLLTDTTSKDTKLIDTQSIDTKPTDTTANSKLTETSVDTKLTDTITQHIDTNIMNTTDPNKPLFEKHWKKLAKFCREKNAQVVSMIKYDSYFKRTIDAEGYFKHVYFTQDNDVLQVFRRSTASQRVVEIASLLALKDKQHIGQIKDIIHDEAGIEMIGLTMERYDMTLKQYLRLHAHQRLTSKQRMGIIIQMLKSLQEAHQLGIAHRDLSSVNFMVNANSSNDEPHLYLIDFGKAVFFSPRDAKKWWVDSNDISIYKDEVKPSSREELAIWCKNLPFVMARPDHGYRFYRSIQTLPKNNKDHDLLPYLIDPAAEDIYSLGTMVWKIFLGIEPWPGVFDTDLKKLRETVSRDYYIDQILDRVMPGPMSKAFLQMFLRVQPHHRKSAADILFWIQQQDVQEALLEEWGCEDGSRRAARNNNFCNKAVTPEPAAIKKPSKKVTATPKVVIPPKKLESTSGRACFPSGLPIGRPPTKMKITDQQKSKTPAPKAEKMILKDGIKYFAKSGTPVGRPRKRSHQEVIKEQTDSNVTCVSDILNSEPEQPVAKKVNPYYSYVKTGKPRGRPRKLPRIRTASMDNVEIQPVPEETDQDLIDAQQPVLTVESLEKTTMNCTQYKVEPLIIKLPELISSQADNLLQNQSKLASPALSPEPVLISRPPSLSPLPDHSRQSSQSTFLWLSPASNNETVEEGDSPIKRKFDGDEPSSPKRRQVDQEAEKSQEASKAQYIDTTDEFDRALYYILRGLGLDKL